MEKKIPDFDPKDVARLAKSAAGQQILSAVKPQDGEKLRAQAAAGDVDGIKKTLSAMLADPQFRALVEKLGR